MTVATYVPELWAAEFELALEKASRFMQPTVINRKYEGEIAEYGDTVHINSISDPAVSTYVPNSTTLTYDTPDTVDQVLKIDTAKSFSFQVDDVDKRQARGDMLTPMMQRAAYKVRDGIDIAIEALAAGAANALGTVQVDTAVKAYDNVLIPLKVELDEANVPEEGRFCIVPPWMHGRLLRDDRFVRADAAGAMTNGVQGNSSVGEAAGFTILVSNNCALVTGDDYRVTAGVSDAWTIASQLTVIEALRREGAFADAIRGLYLYGMKLTRPEMLATALASQT